MSKSVASVNKKFNPLRFLSFKGEYKILHMTWFAFFLTFMVWFNMAPLIGAMKDNLSFLEENPKFIKVLMICNVALTIPARIIIGMILDKLGPRKTFSALLIIMIIPCMIFAFADSLMMMVISRLLLGVIGAGFVIGIRMVAEWFPPKHVGEAEGVYGGFGNFGSAASAFLLPTIALHVFGGEDGWRYSIALTGIMAFLYGFVYFFSVSDSPPGKTYRKPKRHGAMEVTSKGSLYGLILMQIPMLGALAVLVWKLNGVTYAGGEAFLPDSIAYLIYGVLGMTFLFQAYKAWTVNIKHVTKGYPEKDRYRFRDVAILDWAYFATFGSELAVVSMLPLFYFNVWGMSLKTAGMIAGTFAFMNLFARPMGGFLSDRIGSRRRTLTVLVCGLAIGYFLMALMGYHGANGNLWPIPAAIATTMFCSFFVQSGEGAVFAMVPLVKKRVTGQIAGMVGAYGNVGAVIYLTIFSFVEAHTFFLIIGLSAVVIAVLTLFLSEPKGSFADTHHDEEHDEGSEPAAA
ncbi:MAG: NarK family nitrate/nitrite MFS transporter [Planctomycetes bacterium]|nr:NarK family nitrate/nitrite MFS transporter [Planctomycetota bacterium]